MAQIFSMAATGQKQGAFNGSSPRNNWKGLTECYGVEYTVDNQVDANRGSYAGKRRHQPLVVRAAVDKATPQYKTAIFTNEILSSVIVKFYNNDGGGKENNYYTIQLTNAAVQSVRFYTDTDPTHHELSDVREVVEVKFAFQKIECTWTDGGVMASDDWNTVV